MKKVKTSLMLLSIFVLGLVVGFLVSGQITKHKMGDFIRWGTKEGFKEVIIEKIDPEENQMTDLEPVLEKHAIINDELHNSWQKQHGELMRDLTIDLETVLTTEQMEKWRNHDEGHNKN